MKETALGVQITRIWRGLKLALERVPTARLIQIGRGLAHVWPRLSIALQQQAYSPRSATISADVEVNTQVASKTDIEMARQNLAKVTRAEIRLRHALMADAEINEVLEQRLKSFDIQLQAGVIPALALRLVSGEDATD